MKFIDKQFAKEDAHVTSPPYKNQTIQRFFKLENL